MPEIPVRRRPPAEVRERLLAAGLSGGLVSELIVPDEARILECHRMVADAIILERSVRVIERRFGGGSVSQMCSYLSAMAMGLRISAEAAP